MRKNIIISLAAVSAMLFSSLNFSGKCEAILSSEEITLEKGEYTVIRWDPEYDYTTVEYDPAAEYFLDIKNIKTLSGEYYTYVMAENNIECEIVVKAYTVDGKYLSVCIKGASGSAGNAPPTITSIMHSEEPICSTVPSVTPPGESTVTHPDITTTICDNVTSVSESFETTSAIGTYTQFSTTSEKYTDIEPLDPVSTTVSTLDAPSCSDPSIMWIIANDYGDVNSDGYIDLNDLTVMSLALLKDIELSEAEYLAADVNFDYKLNVADLAFLLQYLSKSRDDIVLGPDYIVVYR